MTIEVESRFLKVFEPTISAGQLSDEATATLTATSSKASQVSAFMFRYIRTTQLLSELVKKTEEEIEQRGADPAKIIAAADQGFRDSVDKSNKKRDQNGQETLHLDSSKAPKPTKKILEILKIAANSLTAENPQITNRGLYVAIIEHHHNKAAKILRAHIKDLKAGQHNSFSASEASRERELVMA